MHKFCISSVLVWNCPFVRCYRGRGGQVQSEHAVRAAGRQPGRGHEAEWGVHHGPTATTPAAPPSHISAAAALRVPAPTLPRERLPHPQTPGLHLQRLRHQEGGKSPKSHIRIFLTRVWKKSRKINVFCPEAAWNFKKKITAVFIFYFCTDQNKLLDFF